ncbi:RNA polymerase II elongation factor ELL isoform X2 [Tachyglossus aculeatus]|uniref:RNA polymerase II elongation factor ELL isoform X2 n=1 Tax=Tachyglossus aculeatus TaxID=9261 RepID=UPI0018F41258|nr:RNA polymerase II elongation factor ELL isoform X2 [Tachyglossus aculeatus]
MAALKEGEVYELCCGRAGNSGSNVSVFHVKFTDSAMRALENYRGSQVQKNDSNSGKEYNKTSIPSKPSVQFKKSEGSISIPQRDCPAEARSFTFYLSNTGRDNPQGSFDCVKQYESSTGNNHLDYMGSIQDKITVCATDDSYQKARQSMAQAEEETRSRSAIVIKPGGRFVGKKIQFRKPAPGAVDTVPSRRHPTPINLANALKKSMNNVSQRPIKDRVMHLLALKPYKRPELILRLQKDGLVQPDKELLDAILQQVANTSAKDNTSTLKDCLYKEVQKDWPGYSEGDQQLLKRILIRKLSQPQNTNNPPGNTPPRSSPKDQKSSSPPPQKRPQPLDFIDPLATKKPRISHFAQRMQQGLNGKVNSSNGKEALPPAAQATVPDCVSSSSQLPGQALPTAHNPLAAVSKDVCQNGKDSKNPGAPDKLSLGPPIDCPPPSIQNSSSLHGKTKKKSKKHKEKEKKNEEKHKEGKQDSGLPKNSDVKTSSSRQDATGLNGTCNNSSVPTSTSEMPDYLLKYTAIASLDQRQTYKNDFNAEYNEYRDLHARIERITRRFTQLDSQLKQLIQGSEEYKIIHDQILQEYRKIKKTNANYSQEKNRCEYLHNKLAHIKKLIAEFDQQQLQSWH